MFRQLGKRSVWILAVLLAVSTPGWPAWAQHHGGHGGGHGGHHYGGHGGGFSHGFGGYSHHGFSHHYVPLYFGGYSGLGYGAYGYNAWPYSYTPRAYSYSGPAAVYAARPVGLTPNSYDLASRLAAGATAAGLSYLRNAESSFRTHHYEDALLWGKRAAQEMPRDGGVFLLLSQIHLAVGEYRAAAGALRLGMSLLPTEEWGYVVTNWRGYYHDNDYYAQVERLKRFIAENPSQSDARFLVGYHWVFLGHPDAAMRELSKVAELNPTDEWALRLLELVGGNTSQPQPARSARLAATQPASGAAGVTEPTRSVDASVQYLPPQEFEKPVRPNSPAAAGHQHQGQER